MARVDYSERIPNNVSLADNRRLLRALEEDQLLGPARRVRGARQRVAAGERVDEARLADIGAARERDLDALHARQAVERSGGGREVPRHCEQAAAGSDFGGGEGHAFS